MAGETEQVPAVVHPLVDARAGEQRGGALLGADEVERDEHEEADEDRPWQHRADRQAKGGFGSGRRARNGRGGGLRHGKPPGELASRSMELRTRMTGLTHRGPRTGPAYSGATVPGSHRIPSCRL
ncbi:hypothetical protein STTU_0356 [Streptomyces sp. Tu6071]|nr:hypothetical protein STTU_0356 [Streptomyces sp. Tu6071]